MPNLENLLPLARVNLTSQEKMSFSWYNYMVQLNDTVVSLVGSLNKLKADFEDYKNTHP